MRDPNRRFDMTQLKSTGHGRLVHRDYAAHFFRWVTAVNRCHPAAWVLDVGCGQEMPLARALGGSPGTAPKVYVGVDLNKIKKPDGHQWVTLLDEFDFVSRWRELPTGFSLATCFEVVEHMRPEDALELLKGVRALLDPDGLFLLSTPVFNGRAAKNHIHEYTIDELFQLVNQAGLTVERREGTFGNVKELEKVLDSTEQILWDRWKHRLGNEGLSVIFATDHPDHSRNNLWYLRKGT